MEKQERNKYLEILKELLELRSAIEKRIYSCAGYEEYQQNTSKYNELCYRLYKEIDMIMDQLKSDYYVNDYWIESAETTIKEVKERFTILISQVRGKKNA
jgi:hypothetical protein